MSSRVRVDGPRTEVLAIPEVCVPFRSSGSVNSYIYSVFHNHDLSGIVHVKSFIASQCTGCSLNIVFYPFSELCQFCCSAGVLLR